ncbi:MAG: SIR2 family protein [Clostridiales bacterium]|nr:SIR2 family protein [Clostridiales bacterium]
MDKKITREEAIGMICESSIYGNLGLFIGAGFSKAILNKRANIALSWGELIERIAKENDVDYKSLVKEGMSYPSIASKICEDISKKKSISYQEAVLTVKRQICRLTCWYPEKAEREEYKKYFNTLDPKWIITTNYDLIIESILTEKYLSLKPDNQLTSPNGVVPVYHLHGIRYDPESIIITEEDYTALFRPNEYRQVKLNLLLKESTTVLIGYGLGDINVLTAVDWSKNVFHRKGSDYPNNIIQIVYQDKPQDEAYIDKNDVVIIETSNLQEFLCELHSYRKKREEDKQEVELRLQNINELFSSAERHDIYQFIDNQRTRLDIIRTVSENCSSLTSAFLFFLNDCIEETWNRASGDGCFYGYKQCLQIITDILIHIELEKMPPALFEFLINNMQSVASMIGYGHGESWDGKRYWDSNKKLIPSETIQEIKEYTEQKGYGWIKRNLF